jgi:hypothetical protein
MNPKLKTTTAWLSLTAAICLPGVVAAQQPDVDEPDPNITVQDRPRPDYDPLGIRAGSFFIFPSLTLSGQYDSNVFATNDDEDSDVGVIVAPNVEVESDWSRHALNFSAGAAAAAFADYSQNNYLDAYAATTGRLDVLRSDIVSGTLRIDRLHEDRDDPDESGDTIVGGDDDNEGNLTRYYRGLVDTQYRHNFARFFTVVGGGVQRLWYDDIGDREESIRDRNEYGGRARIGFPVSPRFGTFAEGRYSYRDYDDLDRNSHGYRGSAGVTVDFTSILFGEMALSYSKRDYTNDDLNDASGFGANGSVTWNVTPLTSVILDARSEIDETTVVFEGDEAEANFQNSVGLDVNHELLRNLLLNANARYTRDDFEGTSRTDDVYSVGAGTSYLINRNFSLDATYRFTKRDSDSSANEFDRNIVLLGITAKL